jgi:hypothetical protein
LFKSKEAIPAHLAGPAGYLAAMVDGEGHIAFHPEKTNIARHVLIVNSEKDIIEQTSAACDVLDLPWRIYKRTAQSGIPLFELRISRYENMIRFRELVAPFMGSERKKEKLDAAIAAFRRGEVNDAKRAEVHRLRAEGYTHKTIATLTGVPESTVQYWCSRGGGPRGRAGRPKGYKWTAEERATHEKYHEERKKQE